MATPFACQKSLFHIAIIAFGVFTASSTFAASTARLLPSSDLLALVAPAKAPSLLMPATNKAPQPTLASRVRAHEAASHKLDMHASLVALAMELRDIRYRRGGRNPESGFDCSGFVSYVFLHSIGLTLPATSAAQFVSGIKVARDDMRSGDLVFFRTSGKKRISHVGIYLDDGRFIHAPSSGKVVRIDSLNETYWAKRFAGAKRPDGVALG